ncbi:siderophore-interacting protein [Miniimonas sp. S16]|uniref:siderophore-interacting protein n=1 Tax=Miniimonas sp. S16 TaxID=2171623 RepID=UPI000D526E44|nr:siderophore-interacting protein [Miniimonas sp. S16]
MSTLTPPAVSPFRFFDLRVESVTDLTPSFRRVTLTGTEAHLFADPGWDQRIKVVLPHPTLDFGALPRGNDWYQQWRERDAAERHEFRTYTTRAVRPARDGAEASIDIDMVVHQPVLGPASAWIAQARAGDEVVVLGPNAEWTEGESGGVDFLPPAQTSCHLLVGDETAAPAIAVMLEHLPATARGIAVLELPSLADAAYLPEHPGFEVRVFARAAGERGRHLVEEGVRAARELAPAGEPHTVEEIPADELIWEVPRRARGGAALRSTTMYAWMAGEAGSIRTLRRALVGDLGVDRRTVAFMGYWREGVAEGA